MIPCPPKRRQPLVCSAMSWARVTAMLHPRRAKSLSDLNLNNVLVAVFEGGKLLAASGPVDHPELLDLAGRAASGESDIRGTITRAGKVRSSRLVAHPFAIDGRHFVMLVGESLHATREELELVRGVLYVALPLALLIAGAGGFLLATHSLAPLRWMAEQAKTITDKNLTQRLDIGTAHEELTVLADSFNELLSRLDQSFETMRRFVADASHELRTPLSVIRGEADVALGARPQRGRVSGVARHHPGRSPEAHAISRRPVEPRARRCRPRELARRGILSERSAGRLLPRVPGRRQRQADRSAMSCARAMSRFAATRS